MAIEKATAGPPHLRHDSRRAPGACLGRARPRRGQSVSDRRPHAGWRRLKPVHVGSWNGSFARGGRPSAGGAAKTVNIARRAAVLYWGGAFGRVRWRGAEMMIGMAAAGPGAGIPT